MLEKSIIEDLVKKEENSRTETDELKEIKGHRLQDLIEGFIKGNHGSIQEEFASAPSW